MNNSFGLLILMLFCFVGCGEDSSTSESTLAGGQWNRLSDEVDQLGKPEWRPMLAFMADLHRLGTHPADTLFPHPWEEIGPGYHALAFGHWDIVHATIDVLPILKEHAKNQILNNLANQEPDGLVPGVIWIQSPRGETEGMPRWSRKAGHPPIWPLAVEDYSGLYGDELIPVAYDALILQIEWFEKNRGAYPKGFYYSRISWESGLDDDFRQPHAQRDDGSFWSFLDATCHVYSMYDLASMWALRLERLDEAKIFRTRADTLKEFIQTELFDQDAGYFYDIWSFEDPDTRVESFIGIWPLVTGAATESQAQRVIDEHLLNPERFFGRHPISTIALNSPQFQLLTWRGPTWNSMSYWAARGCLRYNRPDAALRILEAALDETARQYARSGTIWEFHDPRGGRPEEMKREVDPPHGVPRKDYTGHNPLLAMARLWGELAK